MDQIYALVIDDDKKNLRVLATHLARLGIEVTQVNDPTTLPDLIPTLPRVDIVFLDLEMPVASGYDVMPWLREQLGDIPLIACTVHVSEMNVVQRLGFDGFIGKPIDNDRFPDQIERILNGEAVWDRI